MKVTFVIGHKELAFSVFEERGSWTLHQPALGYNLEGFDSFYEAYTKGVKDSEDALFRGECPFFEENLSWLPITDDFGDYEKTYFKDTSFALSPGYNLPF